MSFNKFENSIFRQGAKGREDGTEEYEDAQGKKRVNQFGEDDREQAQSLTDPLRIEEQEYNDTNRKLNELIEAGLIEQVFQGKNRRTKYLVPTKEADSYFAKMSKAITSAVNS